MKSNYEIKWDELNHSYQPSDFSFSTTDEVEINDELLGQEDAMEALDRGLRTKSEGYNIYICTTNHKRIDQAILKQIKKIASTEKKTLAIGYGYNFHCPEEPLLLQLKADDAISLSDELEELKTFILSDLPELLASDEVKNKQKVIIGEYETLQKKYFLEIEEKASEFNILIKKDNEGIHFAPLNSEGENIGKKEFMALSLTKQNEIMEKIALLQEQTDKMMEKLEAEEAKYSELYEDITQEVALIEVGAIIKKLKNKYSKYSILQDYFNDLAEDLLEHLDLIASAEEEQEERLKEKIAVVKNYGFNLMCLPKKRGAPVIQDYDYPQLSLSGKCLFDTENGMIMSDYRYIRPGWLHYASGGYLVLHLQELLDKSNGWQNLKRTLRTGKIMIEGNEELGIALANRLKPQEMNAKLKVILIGSEPFYEALSNYDEEFKALFKVKVNLNDEIGCDKQQIEKLAGIIKGVCKEEALPPITTEALLELVAYGNSQTDDLKRIPANIDLLIDLLREAKLYGHKVISGTDIKECIEARQRYEMHLRMRLDESLQDDTYLIDTEGERIGQVNGLAVYSIGELTFGRPLRITATTYRGQQGIVDIEHESQLSGAIHTKGIHIISGFLGNQFAQEYPLSLSCNICFEQSYVTIDGDSASSGELYAILSSLSGIPIAQNLAVTGSVNQFGEIQPIGGVNEKIDGFYKVCKRRGLKGNEGVIIPKQNAKELNLPKQLIEAVKNREFHIYCISDIWEGAEMMMNKERKKIISCVQEKLKKYNE